MRFISRGAFTVFLAVLAMSVVGSASASAAECHGATKKVVALCAEEKAQFGRIPLTSTGKSGSAGITLRQAGGVEIVCNSGISPGAFNATKEKLTVEGFIIKATGCEVPNQKTTCEVEGKQIQSNELQGALTGTGSIKLTGPKGGASEALFYVTIKSIPGKMCGFTREHSPITGTQTCELPGSTAELVAHVMNCGAAGSNLRWLGGLTTLEASQELKLTGAFTGESWFLFYES
jgi:hypothetical protein